MNEEQSIQSRGYESYHLPASRILRFGAIVTDLCCILGLALLGSLCLNQDFPIRPGALLSLFSTLLLAIGAAYRILQVRFTGRTLGHRLWNLHILPTKNLSIRQPTWYCLPSPLYQRSSTPARDKLKIFLLTVFQLLGIVTLGRQLLLKVPYWISGSEWTLEAFVPPSEDWMITPFFYTLGGWPKKFGGHPIYYTLVYEYGPPSRFVGHVVANWEGAETRMTLEGPKTPTQFPSGFSSGLPAGFSSESELLPAQIKPCIASTSVSWSCVKLREAVLARHFKEMDRIFSSSLNHSWTLRWFTVRAPHIDRAEGTSAINQEPTQGIYLSARDRNRIQDRFIIINGSGTHQALILDRPTTPIGQTAFDLFQQTLRSLRTFSELNPGRAWIDRELSDIYLNRLEDRVEPSLTGETALARTIKLIEIQTRLISKISVDPGSFESFFHLAGTSSILARNQSIQEGVGLSALRNLRSAYQFALDLSPSDPRIQQLQKLNSEASPSK